MFKLDGEVVLPMNAYQMGKNKSHIVFPCFGQPKLDGNRCLAFLNSDDGRVVLLSRRGKEIQHLNAVRGELMRIFSKKGMARLYLDGELHIDGEKDIGLLRRVLGRKNARGIDKNLEARIRFNVFDGFLAGERRRDGFKKRWDLVKKAVRKVKGEGLVRLVPTFVVKKEADVDDVFKRMLNEGYEGLVLRNADGGYLLGGKRSPNVITSKSFGRGEFEVIGFKEGLGKNAGTAVFRLKCLRGSGDFWARPMGTEAQRKDMFRRGKEMIGKKVLVKYIEMDEKTGCVTRNPVVEGVVGL